MNWNALLCIVFLIWTWYNIFKFVPALLHSPVALLALGIGLLLTLIGVFILITKKGR